MKIRSKILGQDIICSSWFQNLRIDFKAETFVPQTRSKKYIKVLGISIFPPRQRKKTLLSVAYILFFCHTQPRIGKLAFINDEEKEKHTKSNSIKTIASLLERDIKTV